jgi:hypothetical protein
MRRAASYQLTRVIFFFIRPFILDKGKDKGNTYVTPTLLFSCYLFSKRNPERINLMRRAAKLLLNRTYCFSLCSDFRQGNPKEKTRKPKGIIRKLELYNFKFL